MVEADPCGVVLELASFFSNERRTGGVLNIEAGSLGEPGQSGAIEYVYMLAVDPAAIRELLAKLFLAHPGDKSRGSRNADEQQATGFQDPIDLTHREVGARKMFKYVRADDDVGARVRHRQALVKVGLNALVVVRKLDVWTVDIDVESDPARTRNGRNEALDDPAVTTDVDDGRRLREASNFFIDHATKPPVTQCSHRKTALIELIGKREVRPVSFRILVDGIEWLSNETESAVGFF